MVVRKVNIVNEEKNCFIPRKDIVVFSKVVLLVVIELEVTKSINVVLKIRIANDTLIVLKILLIINGIVIIVVIVNEVN